MCAIGKQGLPYGLTHGQSLHPWAARLSDAAELMDRFGDDAGYEAAARAERSRDEGNVSRFCHWRQIERVIAMLSSEEVRGSSTKSMI